MKQLKKLIKRLLRIPDAPGYPVTSRHYFPSMILSADDDLPPSRELIDLAIAAIETAARAVDLADIAARPNVPAWFSVWPGEHYRLLGALMQVLKPRVVIEIGTDRGLSALAMKKYLPPDGKIVTFDLRAWDSLSDTAFTPGDFANGRLSQKLDDLATPAAIERNRELLESADFFFIDAPKDNVFEYKLIENLRTLNLRPSAILMFDDTRLWSMLRFWRQLPYPKLDLTSFGSWSGTGLVQWRHDPHAAAGLTG